MVDTNADRVERTALVIKDSLGRDVVNLDAVLVSVYCDKPDCPSFGRRRKGSGRWLGKNAIGQPADFHCTDCGRTTRIRPKT